MKVASRERVIDWVFTAEWALVPSTGPMHRRTGQHRQRADQLSIWDCLRDRVRVIQPANIPQFATKVAHPNKKGIGVPAEVGVVHESYE